MKTKNSIRLEETRQICESFSLVVECAALTEADKNCGSYRCPFYKPNGCKDWIRIEDKDGYNLIPPEEYYEARGRRSPWG